MGKFLTRVYQCRVCGSIISTSEGVQRHGKGCRLKGNIPIPNLKNVEQMAVVVDFPCPKIFLHKFKFPSQLRNAHDISPRTKSNRVRPQYKEVSDSEEEDNIEEQSESSSESDAEEYVKAKKSKKIKKQSSKRPDNPYACPLKGCGTRLKSKHKLKHHFILHLEYNPYACPIPKCEQKLSDQWNFRRHLDYHMRRNDDSCKCKKCGQIYSRPEKLKKHTCFSERDNKRRTGGNSGWRKTVTMKEEDVLAHLRSHFAKIKERGFFLEDNEKTDTESIDLDYNPKIDVNTIIRTDPVFLQICKEHPSFGELIFGTDYKEGGNSRKRGDAFKCKSCSFTTSSLRHLKAHYRSKHASRPWNCAKCGLTFKRELYLKVHMKFHESTENTVYVKRLESGKFECTKCGFVSKHEVSVKRHWLLKHKFVVPSHRKVLPKVGRPERVPRKKKAPKSESEESASVEDEDGDDSQEISLSTSTTTTFPAVEENKCELQFVDIGIIQESENFAKCLEDVSVATVKMEREPEPEPESTVSTSPSHEDDFNLQIKTEAEIVIDTALREETQDNLQAPPSINEEAYDDEDDDDSDYALNSSGESESDSDTPVVIVRKHKKKSIGSSKMKRNESEPQPQLTFSIPLHEADNLESQKLETKTVSTNNIVIKEESQHNLQSPPLVNAEASVSDDDDDPTFANGDFTSESESDSDTPVSNAKPKKKPRNGLKMKKKTIFYNPDNPHPCPLSSCAARLKSISQLKMHFILHLQNNPYACPIPGCTVKQEALSHFKRHMEWHMGKNILSCKKCGQEYARIDKLRSHKCSRKHPRPDANKRNIRSLDDVMAYLKSHFAKLKESGLILQENVDHDQGFHFNYKIDINSIIKTDPVFLQVREENPDFEKQILGDDSNSNYSGRGGRRRGQNYKCEACTFTSGSLRMLKAHHRLKHSSRPWRCAKCGLTFKRELYLEVHMKFHESTKNTVYVKRLDDGKYECTKCGFLSKFEVSVKRHWLLKHNFIVPSHRKVLSKVGRRKRAPRNRSRNRSPPQKTDNSTIKTEQVMSGKGFSTETVKTKFEKVAVRVVRAKESVDSGCFGKGRNW